jgi:hypothetical protein
MQKKPQHAHDKRGHGSEFKIILYRFYNGLYAGKSGRIPT